MRILAAVVVSALFLAGCGSGGGQLSRSSTVTTTTGPVLVPSPNGQWIAYIDPDHRQDLQLRSVDGTTTIVLFHSSYASTSPVWSPDSSAIAWIDKTAEDTDAHPSQDTLKVVDITTRNVRTIVTESTTISRLLKTVAWTSDNEIRFAINAYHYDCHTGDCINDTPKWEVAPDGSNLHQYDGLVAK